MTEKRRPSMANEYFEDDGQRSRRDQEDQFMQDKRKRFHKSRRHEEHTGSFRCAHCTSPVPISEEMGTSHRNHCNTCLWSKHVDEKKGDRKSDCQAGMQPIGLTLKKEGVDRFTGKEKHGDVMLIHECTGCHKVNINRVAADDNTDEIMKVFEASMHLSNEIKADLNEQGIESLGEFQRELLELRLFGKGAE